MTVPSPTPQPDPAATPRSGPRDDPGPVRPGRHRRFTARYKLDIIDEYDNADVLGRGALLRREGLYSSAIAEWRRARDRGALDGLKDKPSGPKPPTREAKKIADLQAALARSDAELATARQVIKVQGELAALLEQLSTSSATPLSGSEGNKP
jgi:transposase-like protein